MQNYVPLYGHHDGPRVSAPYGARNGPGLNTQKAFFNPKNCKSKLDSSNHKIFRSGNYDWVPCSNT